MGIHPVESIPLELASLFKVTVLQLHSQVKKIIFN